MKNLIAFVRAYKFLEREIRDAAFVNRIKDVIIVALQSQWNRRLEREEVLFHFSFDLSVVSNEIPVVFDILLFDEPGDQVLTKSKLDQISGRVGVEFFNRFPKDPREPLVYIHKIGRDDGLSI